MSVPLHRHHHHQHHQSRDKHTFLQITEDNMFLTEEKHLFNRTELTEMIPPTISPPMSSKENKMRLMFKCCEFLLPQMMKHRLVMLITVGTERLDVFPWNETTKFSPFLFLWAMRF